MILPSRHATQISAMHEIASSGENESMRSDAVFCDYANEVREAEADFLVTNRSRNIWWVRRRTIGPTVLQFASVGAGTIADGVMSQADKLIFLMQSTSSGGVYLNGTKLPAHGIAVLAPGCDFIFVNQLPLKWLSFSVELDRLPPQVIDRFDRPIELQAPALFGATENRFAELIRVAADRASLRSRTEGVQSIYGPADGDAEILDMLTTAIESSDFDRCRHEPDAGHQYYAIVRRALAGVPVGEKLHTDDLCRSIGVTERTLQRAFQRILRMPPLRYLKLRQLNQVYAALCGADARGQLVTDILTQHGVTELGRFAGEYRVLFGELPSQTMRRSRI
jgi:AraC family ethanolamine operon transcriptional activator